jgi:copper chaperone CopZ
MSESTYAGSCTFYVKGMTCDHCRRAVIAELTAVAGIASADVDLDTGRVDIVTSGPVSAAEIAAAVDEAGYALATR